MEPAVPATQSGRAWAIFAIGVVSFTLSMFYRVSVTVISPELARDLSLTSSQLSDLSAAFFYVFAFCQIPLGIALDRLGARRVMIVLGAVGAAGAVLFGLASGFATATWGRALMGLGMSCNLMGPFYLIAAWFPPWRFATLTGLLMAIGTLGQLLGATPLVLLAQELGWRGAFLSVAALNVLQVAAVIALVHDRPAGAPPPPGAAENPLRGLGQLLRLPAYWVIGMSTFFRYGTAMAIQGLWAGPYLVYAVGLTPVEAGNALLLMAIGFMVGMPLSGRVSDRLLFTRKYVVMPSLFCSALLFLGLGWVPHGASPWLLYALFLALGLAVAPGQIMYAHIKELVSPGLAARSMTGVNLFTMLGPAMVMQISGLLLQGDPAAATSPGDFWGVWIFMAGGLGAAGLAYLFIPDSKVTTAS
ncbi:MAG: MFS transporter [Desulfarculus sp.]|nr:MAG: MFS transporter [Desulfarculus sp.]